MLNFDHQSSLGNETCNNSDAECIINASVHPLWRLRLTSSFAHVTNGLWHSFDLCMCIHVYTYGLNVYNKQELKIIIMFSWDRVVIFINALWYKEKWSGSKKLR